MAEGDIPLPGGTQVSNVNVPAGLTPEVRNPVFNPVTGTVSVEYRFYNGERTKWNGTVSA